MTTRLREPKRVTWYDQATDTAIGSYEPGNAENPACPLCGNEAHYWKGAVDQDYAGNDIHASQWLCWDESHERICTALYYLD